MRPSFVTPRFRFRSFQDK